MSRSSRLLPGPPWAVGTGWMPGRRGQREATHPPAGVLGQDRSPGRSAAGGAPKGDGVPRPEVQHRLRAGPAPGPRKMPFARWPPGVHWYLVGMLSSSLARLGPGWGGVVAGGNADGQPSMGLPPPLAPPPPWADPATSHGFSVSQTPRRGGGTGRLQEAGPLLIRGPCPGSRHPRPLAPPQGAGWTWAKPPPSGLQAPWGVRGGWGGGGSPAGSGTPGTHVCQLPSANSPAESLLPGVQV